MRTYSIDFDPEITNMSIHLININSIRQNLTMNIYTKERKVGGDQHQLLNPDNAFLLELFL